MELTRWYHPLTVPGQANGENRRSHDAPSTPHRRIDSRRRCLCAHDLVALAPLCGRRRLNLSRRDISASRWPFCHVSRRLAVHKNGPIADLFRDQSLAGSFSTRRYLDVPMRQLRPTRKGNSAKHHLGQRDRKAPSPTSSVPSQNKRPDYRSRRVEWRVNVMPRQNVTMVSLDLKIGTSLITSHTLAPDLRCIHAVDVYSLCFPKQLAQRRLNPRHHLVEHGSPSTSAAFS